MSYGLLERDIKDDGKYQKRGMLSNKNKMMADGQGIATGVDTRGFIKHRKLI